MTFLRLAAGTAALLAVAGVFAAAAAVVGAGGERGEARTAKVARVIDGDTFVTADGARIRVRNFDTPELRRYDCLQEKAAAEGARRAARALLTRQTVRLRVTDRDRYGRLVADVALRMPGGGDRDFVDAMVAAGHGARWDYGNEPQPSWCPERAWWTAFRF